MDNSFNHDMFNTWKKCKAKYYYKYIKKVNWPEFGSDFKTGKEIHALADYSLRGQNIEHLLENASEEVKLLWENFNNLDILNIKLIVTEWPFNAKVPNSQYWLNGRIDAIFYDEITSKYIIADWKSSENLDKAINQSYQHLIYMYSLCNSCNDLGLEIAPENLVFQYIQLSNNHNIEIFEYSLEQYKNNEKEFLKIIKEIENYSEIIATGSQSKDACNDRYCGYMQLCSC